MAATTTRKPRTTKPVPAPTVELLSWSWSEGAGRVRINDTEYNLARLTDDSSRTIGARLARSTEDKEGNPTVKTVDVDFTAAHGWQCDCECATYDPQRGPCKHVQGLRLIGQLIRERDAAEYAEIMAPSEFRR